MLSVPQSFVDPKPLGDQLLAKLFKNQVLPLLADLEVVQHDKLLALLLRDPICYIFGTLLHQWPEICS